MLHHRHFVNRDIDDVMRIETAVFDEPWTHNDFALVLQNPRNYCHVVEAQCVILGYVIYELQPRRLEIWSMAVHPECQRRGVGTYMLDIVKKRSKITKRPTVIARVRERNLPMHQLLKANGFWCDGIAHKFFRVGNCEDEDAYRFSWSVSRRITCMSLV